MDHPDPGITHPLSHIKLNYIFSHFCAILLPYFINLLYRHNKWFHFIPSQQVKQRISRIKKCSTHTHTHTHTHFFAALFSKSWGQSSTHNTVYTVHRQEQYFLKSHQFPSLNKDSLLKTAGCHRVPCAQRACPRGQRRGQAPQTAGPLLLGGLGARLLEGCSASSSREVGRGTAVIGLCFTKKDKRLNL